MNKGCWIQQQSKYLKNLWKPKGKTFDCEIALNFKTKLDIHSINFWTEGFKFNYVDILETHKGLINKWFQEMSKVIPLSGV